VFVLPSRRLVVALLLIDLSFSSAAAGLGRDYGCWLLSRAVAANLFVHLS
jgi:hypothetical protein